MENTKHSDKNSKSPKAKSNTGLIIGIMVSAVLIVSSIDLGIHEMIRANKAEGQLSDLKVQIKNEDGTTTVIDTSKIEATTNDETTITITDTPTLASGGPYIQDNYFYVPQWGWKFKIPEDLTGVGYSVDLDEAHIGYELPFIGFTAFPKANKISNPQAQYYDSIDTCSIIRVNKSPKTYNNYALINDDIEIGDSVLRINGYGKDLCRYDSEEVKNQVYAELKEMFQNPEDI